MNILITGASRGIGYYTALHLSANSKNHVFAVSRDAAGLEKLKAQSKKNKNSGKLTVLVGDFGSSKFIETLVKKLEKEAKSLQILINNAGYLEYAPFEKLSMKDWKKIYEVNVFGPVNLIQHLLPLMKKSDFEKGSDFIAHIVNISSMGGVQGSAKFKGLSAYSSSKGALSILTECLAEEFKEERIAVNCLALGSVQTEMFSAAFPGFTAAKKPEEMGDFIGKFAIEGSKFFNGKVIPVSSSTP